MLLSGVSLLGIMIGLDDFFLFFGILLGCGLVYWRVIKNEKPIRLFVDFIPFIFVFALLGARLYHVLTPPISMVARGITTHYYFTHLLEPIVIWQGGFGFLGALFAGILSLLVMTHFRKEDFFIWADLIVPGVLVAQGFGRWADGANQVLYGLPTVLPWGMNVDPVHRLDGYEDIVTYHPLFAYESIGVLILCVCLLWIEHRKYSWIETGDIFLIYLIGYGVLRWGLEYLRLDISLIAGININQLVSGLLIGFGSFILFIRRASWGKLK